MSHLNKIYQRVEAATPGPWRVRRLHNGPNGPSFVEAPKLDPSHPYNIEILGEDTTLYPTREADLEFIAHARTDIPYLLEVIRHLENQLEPFSKL